MGTDIYTKNGILFTVDEAVEKFFQGLKKKDIEDFKNNFTTESWQSYSGKLKTDLEKVKTLKDFKAWFLNFAEKQIVKCDYDEYINGDILEKMWNILVSERLNLPEASFEYFTSNRYNGYDVPTKTICVAFNCHGLFERKLTKEGKRVAKIMKIKDLQPTEWTVYSY